MPFRCYKCHKMIYNGSPEFHNIFCFNYYRNNSNNRYNNNNYNYNNNNRNYYNNDRHIEDREYRNRHNNRNNSRDSFNRYYRTHNRNSAYIYNNRNNRNNINIRNNRNNINIRNNNNRNNNRNRNINHILELLINDDLDLDFLFNNPEHNSNDNDNNSNESSESNESNESNDVRNLDNESLSSSSDDLNGLDESIINNFPKIVVEDASKLKEKNCVICLEDYKNGEEKTTIPCFHTFHPKCINKWLKAHNTCPICKYEIKK